MAERVGGIADGQGEQQFRIPTSSRATSVAGARRISSRALPATNRNTTSAAPLEVAWASGSQTCFAITRSVGEAMTPAAAAAAASATSTAR
ncbi:MAG: hypothetical protein U1F35_06025 [Steroidobacteraceae bacterium]